MTTLIPKYDLMNGGSTPTGAINRPINLKLGDFISVMDFGAKGDGVTDDTTAIQNAINTATIGTNGQTIYFPKGTYVVSGLTITSSSGNNNTTGENSLNIVGLSAVLKGNSSCSQILSITSPNNTTFTNGINIQHIQFDMSLMSNAATSRALYIKNSYDNDFRDLTIIGQPALGYGIYIDQRAYTNSFYSCNLQTVGLFGADVTTDAITTCSFYSLNATQVILSQCSQISFFGCIIQGNNNLFNIYSSANITIIGGDFEGTAGYYLNCAYAGTGTQHGVNGITSINNNITNGLTYIIGTANASNLADLNRYGRAYVNGTPVTTISTTTATTIYTFSGDPVSGSNQTLSVALVVVCGDDGFNGYCDLLGIAYSTVFVINSHTVYGSPPTRTYTISGASLQLARSAATAGNTRVTLLANNSSN